MGDVIPLTNFPTSLDSWTGKVDNVDDVLAAHVNKLQDAVDALEVKLGIDSSAVVTTIEYILKNASSANPGHSHSLIKGATDVTATAAEINTTVDGCTVTAAQLNSLLSNFASLTEPGTMYAGMLWADTTTHILKIRNEANNAWQSIWNFAANKPVIANLSNEITNAMCAAALKDPAAGTAGLRTLGTAATAACAGNDARLSDNRTPLDNSVTAANLLANKYAYLSVPTSVTPLQVSADTQRSTSATSYTKVKEVKIPKGGTLRIGFELAWATIGIAYARIYRNGGAVGTERSTTSETYVTFSEDIAGWTENDLCQLYYYTSHPSGQARVKNFKIYAANYEITLD